MYLAHMTPHVRIGLTFGYMYGGRGGSTTLTYMCSLFLHLNTFLYFSPHVCALPTFDYLWIPCSLLYGGVG